LREGQFSQREKDKQLRNRANFHRRGAEDAEIFFSHQWAEFSQMFFLLVRIRIYSWLSDPSALCASAARFRWLAFFCQLLTMRGDVFAC
jgi:hypothetical protein